MDSKLYGMPLSTTQATTSPSPTPPPKFPSGIRAPLTIDSDVEFEYSNGHTRTYNISSESEEGFLSGEDDFETASERPFVVDPNEETLQETDYFSEYVVSRPFVKYPDGINIQQSSNVTAYGDFRPFVTTPDDNLEESSNLGELYDDSRPYLTDQDDEIVEDNFPQGPRIIGAPGIGMHFYNNGDFRPSVGYTNGEPLRVSIKVEDEEYASDASVETPKVDALLSKQGKMPIALVSGDSDEGSVHSDILEDDGCSDVVRIPDAVVSESFNGAPKVRVLEVEEGEGEESESGKKLQTEVVKDSISAGDVNGILSFKDEEENIAVDENVHGFILDEVVEDKVVEISGVNNDTLVGNEECKMVKELVFDSDVIHSDAELQSDGGETETMDLDKNMEHTDHAERTNKESKDANLIGSEAAVSQVEDYESPCGSLEAFHDEQNYEENHIDVCDTEDVESRNVQKTVWIDESNAYFSASKNNYFDSSSRENEIQSINHAASPKKLAAWGSVTTEGFSPDITRSHLVTGQLLGECNVPDQFLLDSDLIHKTTYDSDDDPSKLVEEEEGPFVHNDAEGFIFKESVMEEQEMEQLSQSSSPASTSAEEISEDHLEMDGQVITDSDEEVEGEDRYQTNEIFDPAALAALLKAAAGAESDGGGVTMATADGNRIYSLERPAGLGSMFHPMLPSTRPVHPNISSPAELENIPSEEAQKKLEKLQEIRVNYLRLLHRLNRSIEDPVAAQVLYRLFLAARRPSLHAFSLESAKDIAMELEAERKNDLNFSINILVIGKTGVGKSATINSIFGEKRASVDAFEPTTTSVKEINGVLDGIKIRVLDTPGLRSPLAEHSLNCKILSSIKKCIKKFSPDVVLYVDRLDMQTRDLNDLPLLKSVTRYLGSSIWGNAIIALTHAASTPPGGSYGYPSSYEVFVAQRSRVIQQLINHSVSDVNMVSQGLMRPVSLVENNSCHDDGKMLLPSGENWRSQLLLLCYSTKILSGVASVVKTQDISEHRKLFGFRIRSPPLLYFLTSLLQSNVHPKLSTDQGGDNGDSDIELAYSSESDLEDEGEYDQLPPFKPLKKSQIAKLSKDQQKAYFEEYDYRVKLLQKKQWREEVKRIQEMKKGKARRTDYSYTEEEEDQVIGSPASVAVPLPDMVLPPSFDGDNAGYRYRFLEHSSQLLTRAVLDPHGWDHDCGYDGVSIEDRIAVADRFPAVIAVQLTKDKKEFNIHLNSSVSAKHGENGSTMAGLDIQTIGKQLAYILKSELKVRNYRINKTAAGTSVTFFGENVVTGLKVEDQIAIGKRLALVGNTGITYSRGDAAYGANMEVRLRDKDYPIGQDHSTLSLSAMRWRGDLVWGCNLESQLSVGRNSKMTVRAGLNNKMSGQISVRTSSSDQLQIAILALIPIAKTIYRNIFLQSSEQDRAKI